MLLDFVFPVPNKHLYKAPAQIQMTIKPVNTKDGTQDLIITNIFKLYSFFWIFHIYIYVSKCKVYFLKKSVDEQY